MKTLFTLFSFLLIFGQAIGQGFSVSGTDTTFYGEVDDGDFAAKFLLYNDSSEVFPMTWEIDSETIQAGWEYSICDPSDCHPVGATTGSFDLPVSATNRIMNIHYYPNENYGESTVVVKVWDNAYPDDFVLLAWTGIVLSSAGLNDPTLNSIVAYAQNQTIKVQYSIATDAQNLAFVLYDLSGKEVDRTQVLNSDGTISIGENLQSGLYIYSLVLDGKTIVSKKIVL